ncbi:MAG: DUF4860 domain-containing protein [Coriobacteriia bacterium]|nr:DUF4860 domain-containing protein [Coriobacteriia bacterium]
MDINYAVVSAFERSKVTSRKEASSRTFTIALMAVFFVALMAGLAAGVSIYRSVAQVHVSANEMRLESGLLANSVHVADAADAVDVGQGPEGKALVLVERLESGTYETRIYQYQGNIVQEYAIQGRDYAPDRAQVLTPSATFDFTYDKNLLTVSTDQGSFDVALRSAQGGGKR